MMADKDDTRRSAFSLLNKRAKGFGMEAAECGKTAKVADFNTTSGYWAEPGSVTQKPPRWLLQIEVGATTTVVKLPPHKGCGRTAYYNTANRKVGVCCFRIMLAVRFVNEPAWKLLDSWDWLAWFAFNPALRNGSSGQVIDELNPATGKLTYMGNDQPYVGAGLVALCDPALSVTGTSGQVLTYRDATAALAAFINVNPVAEAIEVGNSEGSNDGKAS
jgi:hypothetical protein